ncbi:MAG: putative RNA uridine N3 methyltransferase [Nitrososphaera sp.]|uniref:putative RNA uridine N3 methyltransferase n=1 Tax=Nitrososphaera sp. TaxID=1971748 RepID=UPI003D6DB2E0
MTNLWVAIPDSALSDEQTKRDKSVKIAQFARACSIFRVKRIYIYHDPLSQFEKEDPVLLRTILRYLDTPQYLRRVLYPRMNELEFAGILHPIKAPHHRPPQDIKTVRAGDVRTGVIAKVKGALFVEVGLGSLVPFDGEGSDGKKVNVKFTSPHPHLRAMEATELDIFEYWGYEVKEVPSIVKLLSGIEKTTVIATSRKGGFIKNNEAKLAESIKNSENVLVIFGSPKHGVHEIIAKESSNIKPEFMVNMFPNQATETVRLEEAVLGTLAILNASILSRN